MTLPKIVLILLLAATLIWVVKKLIHYQPKTKEERNPLCPHCGEAALEIESETIHDRTYPFNDHVIKCIIEKCLSCGCRNFVIPR